MKKLSYLILLLFLISCSTASYVDDDVYYKKDKQYTEVITEPVAQIHIRFGINFAYENYWYSPYWYSPYWNPWHNYYSYYSYNLYRTPWYGWNNWYHPYEYRNYNNYGHRNNRMGTGTLPRYKPQIKEEKKNKEIYRKPTSIKQNRSSNIQIDKRRTTKTNPKIYRSPNSTNINPKVYRSTSPSKSYYKSRSTSTRPKIYSSPSRSTPRKSTPNRSTNTYKRK